MKIRIGFLIFKLIFLCFLPEFSTAQVRLNDTLNKPKFGRASLELGLAEIAPYVLDRYVRHAKVYYISFKTLSNNIKPSSWAFDNDPLGTNQFGHPYHGSLFLMRTGPTGIVSGKPHLLPLWVVIYGKLLPKISHRQQTILSIQVLVELYWAR